MPRAAPSSPEAASTLSLVEALQRHLVDALGGGDFAPVEWLRDDGRHGGGQRLVCAKTPRFNRASINVSCVHHEDAPTRPLRAATALSAIVHPDNPHAPSLHLHLSFTELRGRAGTWRLMADLNPSTEDPEQTARFEASLRASAPAQLDDALARGLRYFFIPALGRHRGVRHFYLEDFTTSDFEADRAFAERLGRSTVDTYAALVNEAMAAHPTPDDAARARQLDYHTLYVFQVLTLDRGTTSGLLAHAQNDLGIMGSLPSWIDRPLLASWASRAPPPQDTLVHALVALLPEGPRAEVTDDVRRAWAKVVRAHYQAHPEAMALQASGS